MTLRDYFLSFLYLYFFICIFLFYIFFFPLFLLSPCPAHYTLLHSFLSFLGKTHCCICLDQVIFPSLLETVCLVSSSAECLILPQKSSWSMNRLEITSVSSKTYHAMFSNWLFLGLPSPGNRKLKADTISYSSNFQHHYQCPQIVSAC